jgi:poly(glycerol-phosphate) alpha-glucosyltransferase
MIKFVLHYTRNKLDYIGGIDKYISLLTSLIDSISTKRCHSLKEIFLFINYNKNTIIHLHNIWDYTNLCIILLKKIFKVSVVITIHGMLDSWALKKSNIIKKLAIFTYVKIVLDNADIIICLTEKEKIEVEIYTLNKSIKIIPNYSDNEDEPYIRNNININGDYIYIGRLDSKKNIINLLLGWKNFVNECQNKNLIIIGDGDAEYKDQILALISSQNILNVKFLGWLDGREKFDELRRSKCFLLPSYSEGLPISALEALSQGIPTLLSRECNFEEDLFSSTASIPVGLTPEDIYDGLIKIEKMSLKELHQIGINAKVYYYSKYSKKLVKNLIKEIYA